MMKGFGLLMLTALCGLGAVALVAGCTLTQGVALPDVPSQGALQPTREQTPPVSATSLPEPEALASPSPEVVPHQSTALTARPGGALPTPEPLTPPGLPTLPAIQPSGAPPPPADWQVYHNPQYGFELRYPPGYVILPPQPPEPATPQPIFEVLFQDHTIAGVDVERIEPPMFAVRVFDNRARESLDSWLNRYVFSAGRQNLDVTPYASGVKVCTRLMIAPGCFIYLANGDYIYQLTLLGESSERMAASFRFVR